MRSRDQGSSTLQKEGIRLDARVKLQLGLSWGQVRSLIETGKIFVGGNPMRDPAVLVSPVLEFDVRMNAPKRGRDVPASIERGRVDSLDVIFQDAHLLVVNKASGVNSVPYREDRGSKGSYGSRRSVNAEERSLLEELESHFSQRLWVVQRLDRETSGLMVFARSQEAFRGLSQQFRFHRIHRKYLAVVYGRVPEQVTYRTSIARDRGDGLRGYPLPGVRVDREDLQSAVTHVRALRTEKIQGVEVTWIECQLETGRTHQIRIHLSEAGHPLVGERVYGWGTDKCRIESSRVQLHAAELGFDHPVRAEGSRMFWSCVPPESFLQY